MLAGALVGLSLITTHMLRAAVGVRPELALLAVGVATALAFIPVRARLLAFADRYVSDRTVRTLVFVDVVDSTARALSLGDRRWRDMLERFRSTARRSLARLGGNEIDTAGDGFFVTFEGPDRAIRWAGSLVEAVRSLGLEIRAGAHVGEVEIHGHHVTGIAVHVAARVMASAAPGRVIVSEPLRDLVAGSEIRLVDLGLHPLKGLPGEWRLFAVSAGHTSA